MLQSTKAHWQEWGEDGEEVSLAPLCPPDSSFKGTVKEPHFFKILRPRVDEAVVKMSLTIFHFVYSILVYVDPAHSKVAADPLARASGSCKQKEILLLMSSLPLLVSPLSTQVSVDGVFRKVASLHCLFREDWVLDWPKKSKNKFLQEKIINVRSIRYQHVKYI